jgi:hypothetical protein
MHGSLQNLKAAVSWEKHNFNVAKKFGVLCVGSMLINEKHDLAIVSI